MSDHYNLWEFVCNDAANVLFGKLMSIIKISISVIKECEMSRIITNNKQIAIGWQPGTASGLLFSFSNFKAEFFEWFITFYEIFFVLFLIWLIHKFQLLLRYGAIPNLDEIIRFNRQNKIQKWMILQIPNRLLYSVVKDSHTEVLAISLWILFFASSELWNIPSSDGTFMTRRKDKLRNISGNICGL